MLTMWQTCPAKYELRKQGWTTRRRSGALGFGGAIHLGLAEWYRTGNQGLALAKIAEGWPDNLPSDDFRTKEKCLQTMMEYIRRYPSEPFSIIKAGDTPMIEIAFTLDTNMFLACPQCWHINSDPFRDTCECCNTALEHIEYGGIMDGIVEFGPQIYILEHKTTTQMGATYFNQFNPNNQITGYVWGASVMSGKRVGGALVNGIGIYKASATKFERKPTSRSQAQIDEWLMNVRQECIGIQRHEAFGHFPMRTGSCMMYGACEYHSVHVLPEGTAREKRLELDYVKDHWDYEKRDDNA